MGVELATHSEAGCALRPHIDVIRRNRVKVIIGKYLTQYDSQALSSAGFIRQQRIPIAAVRQKVSLVDAFPSVRQEIALNGRDRGHMSAISHRKAGLPSSSSS